MTQSLDYAAITLMMLQEDQACVSQKTRKLLVPENFSGLYSGAFLGFRKAFLKAPDFLPRFSGMFSGNVTQGIARASNFQPVIG